MASISYLVFLLSPYNKARGKKDWHIAIARALGALKRTPTVLRHWPDPRPQARVWSPCARRRVGARFIAPTATSVAMSRPFLHLNYALCNATFPELTCSLSRAFGCVP